MYKANETWLSMKVKKKTIFFSALVIFIALAFYPSPENLPIKYVDRQTGEIKIEKLFFGG